MQIHVQDYGVIDFRPEEVYRFDGREDLTQLRGSIRTNPNNDWVSHNYWYDLRDVLVAHSNDLNLVIGLPVLTRVDLDREQQLCNKCGKPISECCEGNGVPKPGVDSGLYLSAENLKRIIEDIEQDGDSGNYFTAESLKQAYDTFTDELQAVEAADDTDIEEEIQRVLSAMRQLNLLAPDEVRVYRDLINALHQLKEIQAYI